ncbi:MAG: cytochrome c [Gemmatimonadaceae bacterium]|jgi:cytochrome c553
MRKFLRATAWGIGIVVALLVVAGCGLYFYTQRGIDRKFDIAGHAVTIPTDSLALVRGQHVAAALGKCIDCHGADLGGRQFIDVPPVARLYAANLTRGKGGVGGQLSDLDWERAIRHGVKPDGSGLLFMPSLEFQFLKDEDLAALIAYIKSMPPVDREPAKNSVGPIGRLLYAKGELVLVPAERVAHATHPVSPPAAVSPEYGRYLAEIGGCTGCHGEGFSGGKIPGTPPDWKPAANITPTGIGHYTEEDFFRALREGKRPGNVAIDSLMPYRFTKLMTDDEIRALWLFLKTVPPKPYGGR